MRTELYAPSRCTAKLPDVLDNPNLVAELKIDGSRYVLYFDCDPYERQAGNTLLSRRPSVTDGRLVDKTANVPHITKDLFDGLGGTILDGEMVSADFTSTNSIMNSAPRVALQKQKEIGLITYHVFDIMAYKGVDVRNKTLAERRKILKHVIEKIDNPHIKMVEQVTENLEEFFNKTVAKGGEGIVVKDLRMAYGVGWAKMKKSYDVTCFVSGFKDGNGKYKGGVGAIAISVWRDDFAAPIEVGFASGFDDATRADMTKNPKKYMGRSVDIFAQEISKDNRLRHPTFHRFRDDVLSHECTIEKLKKDIAVGKKAKSRRIKDE
jgi:ATP-dependent DNA ligase